MINLTLLGSGGGMPMPNRHLSSMVINYQGRQILMDCGEGSQVAMRRIHNGFKSIDIICITHYHGDHIFGLSGLLSTIGNSGRTESITIVGPIGLGKIMKGLLVAIPFLPYDINLVEISERDLILNVDNGILRIKEDDNLRNKDIILSTLELDHSSTCLGYGFYIPRRPKFIPERAMELGVPKDIWSRLQSGKTVSYKGKIYEPNMVLGEERKGIKLTYITDTRPIDEIVDFIKDSDFFVCEGTYGDDKDIEKAIKNKHMTFREAAELALKGDVKELLLTHFSSAMEEPELFKINATDVFKSTIIGYDGYMKTINYN